MKKTESLVNNSPSTSIAQQDQDTIWHPYTQMQTAGLAIPIVKAKAATLYAEDGSTYIDAISSWWVNLYGHSHPYIAKKVYEQLLNLEHVIFAGFTHPPAVHLSRRLLEILPNNQSKIFFSDNGSTAVEVGLKMAFQYWYNKGIAKTKVVAFKNAYHGDTFGAMAVSGRSAFTAPFASFLFDVHYIDVPVNGKEKESLAQLEALLQEGDTAAFIFEPLVQGAGGMIMYEPTALDALLDLCKQNEVICIADEVMTGFGRTGKYFACEYLHHQPDIMCLSKGITGGTMALAVTTCSQTIYDAFLSDDKLKTFFHGHSYTANPTACAAALASMDLLLQDDCSANLNRINKNHLQFNKLLQAKYPDKIANTRLRGTIFALEIKTKETTSYLNNIRDFIAAFFLEKGVLLRPLGNVVYILPPYCISNKELERVYAVIMELLERID